MAKHWGKVLTAMVTPFDAEGRLNLDMACRLARHLADNGSDGLVLAATTGEAPTLSDAERFDLIRAVSEAVTIPVLAGTGSNDTRHALEMTAKAEAAGAAGVFLVGPYYNRPPQAGIEAHFRALAAATRLPVMLYDVPGRTGRRICHDVLLRLFREVDNLVAFKDATGDPAAAARLVAEAGEHFELYSGDDALTLPLLAVGAVGVVGTSTHWTGPLFATMIAAFEQGDIYLARAINAALQPSFAFSNTDASVYSMSVKAMLRSQGLPVGECRLPLPPAPPEVEPAAREVWRQLQAWRQQNLR
ncbi:4-hydroxy-tetrahydrodipicolinate synthase [Chromobacterium sp. IIBBL 290-4]|uniref:4-hydroxy-tetrahydrodipicolinate synthase n=1 Tax=Chromobacterium sp. IIBBL 290-4 TaxID=2953890 RepID=UPI0020B6F701|nr:4-hydroxy-tetrahydrodipicolinate synthase [Chromobacterium sp. IIBBL 290-4]UTH74023.1 4-hydroxy-tetrahydrodipicolinate synthase [Chromobacterium sp. IIBBL 290-4]